MQNTMSQPASSGKPSAILAPSLASGSAFARVRFHTVMSQPPFASRRAISNPMRPAPSQPSFTTFAAVNSTLLGNYFGAGSITARTVPTGTVVPDSTRIALSTPLTMAGISVVTLSVSTSKRGSSALMLSPTFLYQLATVPSVTVSPSWGMITSISSVSVSSRRAARSQASPDFRDDARNRWHDRVLELVGGGQRNVGRRDPDDRSLELAENLLLDDRGDLGAPAAQPRVFLDGEDAPGARRFGEQRPRIERHERAHVDHRRGNSVLRGERLRRLERPRHHGRERDQGGVPACAQHFGLPQGLDVLAVGNLALVREQALVLEEDDGIRIAYRRGEESFRIGRRGGCDDLESGNSHRPVLHALRVLRAEARTRAVCRADDERNRDLPVAHVAGLGDFVGDVIPAASEEIREHDLGDRLQARHRRAHRRAEDGEFRDRRVLHAPGAELFEQPDRGLEHAARGGRVLAEQYDALVAPHFLRDSGGDRFPVAQLRHALPPSAHTSVMADSSAGVGDALAASVAWSSFAMASASIFASVASAIPLSSSRLR